MCKRKKLDLTQYGCWLLGKMNNNFRMPEVIWSVSLQKVSKPAHFVHTKCAHENATMKI